MESGFRVDTGPCIVGSPGGITPRLAVRPGMAWNVIPRASIRLTGLVTVFGTNIEALAAESTFRFGLVGVGGALDLVYRGPVRLSLIVDGGLSWIQTKGISEAFEVLKDSALTGIAGSRFGICLVTTRHV